MQKFIFIFLVLFLCACNKIEKLEITEESIKEITEQTSLTEAEAWKLFDEFWLEFQKAVVEDDEEAIRSMCEIGIDKFGFVDACKNIKNYNIEYLGNETEYFKNLNAFIVHININKTELYIDGNFYLINRKYKLVDYYVYK